MNRLGGLYHRPTPDIAHLEDDLEKEAVEEYHAAKRKEAEQWQSPTIPSCSRK
jgi:hypothetical protein